MVRNIPYPKGVGVLGRPGRLQAIDGVTRHFNIEDEVHAEQQLSEKNTRKLICFQKLRFKDNSQVQYRFTYYMIGLKEGARGRWVFGQYSLLIPPPILRKLLRDARRRGWKV